MLAGGIRTSSGNPHVFRGIEAYEAGEYNTAIEEFKSVIDDGDNQYELEVIYNLLGNSYLKLELIEEAERVGLIETAQISTLNAIRKIISKKQRLSEIVIEKRKENNLYVPSFE